MDAEIINAVTRLMRETIKNNVIWSPAKVPPYYKDNHTDVVNLYTAPYKGNIFGVIRLKVKQDPIPGEQVTWKETVRFILMDAEDRVTWEACDDYRCTWDLYGEALDSFKRHDPDNEYSVKLHTLASIGNLYRERYLECVQEYVKRYNEDPVACGDTLWLAAFCTDMKECDEYVTAERLRENRAATGKRVPEIP